MKDKRARWRERRAKLLLLLGSTLFAVIGVEIGLRLYGYSYPEFYVTDLQRGYALGPGIEGWYRKEGRAYVRINSDGLRDREHSKPKPPNTLRVAVLGDSYIEALQVPFEDSFCAVLERKLRECPNRGGREVEVISFGVSGYGTAQQLITLREHVWQYAPDVVLLAVTTNNDISDSVRPLKKVDQIPYFVWRDGNLVEDTSFQQTKGFQWRQSLIGRVGRWFRDHLRVVQGIDEAQRSFRLYRSIRNAAPQTPPATSGAPEKAVAQDIGIDNEVYREPAGDPWNEAWRTTEGLISLMRDEVEAKGAKFLVVTLSNGIQVWPKLEAREAFLRRIGARDILYPDKRIHAFCESKKISSLILAPVLQNYADTHDAFLHGFDDNVGNGHWNVLGHRVAGEAAAVGLCMELEAR